ncbi:hypothetical protein BGZ60DRAFT_532008 [Tricladium varicosporioides]|nr:hypothetical protein BGZ60DRAFT_532008 [Hymenoscyphus varicosporioides]
MGYRKFDPAKHILEAFSTLKVDISRSVRLLNNLDGSQLIKSSYAASFGRASSLNIADILPLSDQTRARSYPGVIVELYAIVAALQIILAAYIFRTELMRAMDENIWQLERHRFRDMKYPRRRPTKFKKQFEVVMYKCQRNEHFGAKELARTASCLESPVWKWPLSGDNVKRILGLIPIGDNLEENADAIDTEDGAEESESECSCEDCEDYEPPEVIV